MLNSVKSYGVFSGADNITDSKSLGLVEKNGDQGPESRKKQAKMMRLV